MKILSEVKVASFMAKNMNKTIAQWAKDLHISQKEATRIYKKYKNLGLLQAKGFSVETRERLSKFNKMAYHKFQAAKLEAELQA